MTVFEPGVPARYRHFLERDGLIAVGHLPIRRAQRAVIGAVPTMHHAAELLEAVIAQLGDRAWIDPSWTAYDRRVHVRDSDRNAWMVATSVLEHRFVDRHYLEFPGVPNAPPPPARPAPEIVPEGPLMRAGDLILRDGAGCLQIGYDQRGLQYETLHRPRHPARRRRRRALAPANTAPPSARPPWMAIGCPGASRVSCVYADGVAAATPSAGGRHFRRPQRWGIVERYVGTSVALRHRAARAAPREGINYATQRESCEARP